MTPDSSETGLPDTGEIERTEQEDAAELVEDLATGSERPDAAGERLLIVLDIDGTVLLEDETLSPGSSRPSPTPAPPATR